MRNVLNKIPALRRLYYAWTSPIPYRRLSLDRTKLSAAVRGNRAALARIKSWISDETYENSIFSYGLPGHIRGAIDLPLSDKPSYTDLLVYLAREAGEGLRYLELGPSVGKTFYQMLSSVRDADLVAVDIEDINPTLANLLQPERREEWQGMPDSMRERPHVESHFIHPASGNRLRYIAGDLFDPKTWQRLEGATFNLVFSDAFHSSDALLLEWANLRDRNLLAPEGFTMVWDDLTSPAMRGAFNTIAQEMQAIYGRAGVQVSLELFQGWVGSREFLHPIGVVRYRPQN